MQNDFIDGALGTKEAVAIVPKVEEKIRNIKAPEFITREQQEGKNLPVPHCIKGSNGWEICEELKVFQNENTKVFDKPAFGSVELAGYLKTIENLESVTLVGLCTDICVISNAMVIKANHPEYEIKVIDGCCAGVKPQIHKIALMRMKLCKF